MEYEPICTPTVIVGVHVSKDRIGFSAQNLGGVVAVNTDFSAVRAIPAGTYSITGSFQAITAVAHAQSSTLFLIDRPLGSAAGTFGRALCMFMCHFAAGVYVSRAISIPKLYIEEGREALFYVGASSGLSVNDQTACDAIWQAL